MTIKEQRDYITRNLAALLKSFLEENSDTIELANMSYGITKKALQTLGFEENEYPDTNGWAIDYWVSFDNLDENTRLSLEGSMYDGNLTIVRERIVPDGC